MLIQIGQSGPRPASDDPVDLLDACHGRIRGFTATAERLAHAKGHDPSEVSQAASAVHRYYTIALPLHVDDEELSLSPRLRAGSGGDELLQALASMEQQHVAIAALIAELVPAWATLADEPGRLGDLASLLAAPTRRLGELWGPHLALEEGLIFPALRRMLSEAARAALLAEMRQRREAIAPALRARWADPQATLGCRVDRAPAR
ncbi:MAG: hemerythrin domain-containing protein [Minicystis sp.]